MTNFRLAIHAVNTSVTRPVVNSILNELKNMLGISKNVHTKVTTDTKDYANKYWNAGNQSNSGEVGVKSTVLTCKYSEGDYESVASKIRRNDAKPIVDDKITEVIFKPLSIKTIANLELTLFSKSESKLLELVNRLRVRYLENRDANLHSIQYIYYMRTELIGLLKDVNAIQNIMEPTNIETLSDYITRITDDRATTVGSQSGDQDKLELAFKERQNKVLGFFSSDMLNMVVEFDKDKGYWFVSFNYEFRYDKPLYIDISYPPIVYNRLLPKKYITYNKSVTPYKEGNLTETQSNIERFKTDKMLYDFMNRLESDGGIYIKYPSFDTHANMEKFRKTHRVFSTLVTITSENRRFLCNLRDLGDLEINEHIIDFIAGGEWQYITEYFKSIFYIEIYENDIINYDLDIIVDENLDVYSTTDLDIRNRYRLMFSLLLDTTNVEHEGVDRFLANEHLRDKLINIAGLTTGANVNSLDFFVNKDMSVSPEHEQARAWTVQYSSIASEILSKI